MRKWLRTVLIVILLLLVAAVSVPLFLRHRMYARPAWYPSAHLSDIERAAAANRADQKMIRARGQIVDAYAAQIRTSKAGIKSTTGPAGTFSLALTEDEINSWIPKWKDELGWGKKSDKYLTDPTIVFHEGEIILAATVKDWNTIVSLHFLPALDADKLRLTLTNVMAGTLPLPKVAWSGYESRLLNGMQSKIPEFQRKAEIDPQGKANGAAVSAAMSQLLVHTLNSEPAAPVLFLPDQISRGSRSLPVHITAISVDDKTLTLTVEPMDGDQRAALLQQLRGSADAQTAMNQ